MFEGQKSRTREIRRDEWAFYAHVPQFSFRLIRAFSVHIVRAIPQLFSGENMRKQLIQNHGMPVGDPEFLDRNANRKVGAKTIDHIC